MLYFSQVVVLSFFLKVLSILGSAIDFFPTQRHVNRHR